MVHLNYKRFGEMRSCPLVDVKTIRPNNSFFKLKFGNKNIPMAHNNKHYVRPNMDQTTPCLDLSISLLYFWWFRRQLLYVTRNHFISCYLFRRTSRSVSIKSLHWTICVYLKPFVNACVNSYFTQPLPNRAPDRSLSSSIISQMVLWWIIILKKQTDSCLAVSF